jgi:hypothetical protein
VVKVVYEKNRCKSCYQNQSRRVKRPSQDFLCKEVKEFGYSAVGRKYGVSDNAIRKWLKIDFKS